MYPDIYHFSYFSFIPEILLFLLVSFSLNLRNFIICFTEDLLERNSLNYPSFWGDLISPSFLNNIFMDIKCWTNNFFQYFKYIIPLSSGWYGFWWEIHSHLKQCKPLTCLITFLWSLLIFFLYFCFSVFWLWYTWASSSLSLCYLGLLSLLHL